MNPGAPVPAHNAVANFRRRLLITILNNDLPSLRNTLEEARTALGAGTVHGVLTQPETLPSPGRQLRYTMLQAMRTLLVDHMPDLRSIHFTMPQLMLPAHLRSYRGQPIHVAVALKRLDIVGGLLDFHREHCSEESDQLQAMDSCHNTALSLAVRWCDGDTVACLLRDRVKNCSDVVMEFVVRHGFEKNVPRLMFSTDPRLGVILGRFAEELLGLNNAEFESSRMLLLWYLYWEDRDKVVEIAERRRLYNCAPLEPNPFHFMSAIICDTEQYGNNRYTLDKLRQYEEDMGWLGPNDVSTVSVGGQTYASGTAAHMALLNYRPTHLVQMHPGFVSGTTLHTMPQPELDIPLVARALPLRRFLHDLSEHFGVDMLKPNLEQKTPLDCLPPDAHPAIIQKLVELQAASRT